jgi:predicted MFS family arabinose efflux permease
MTRDVKLLLASIFLWGAGEGLFIYLYPLHLEALGAQPVAIGSIMSLAALVLAASHLPAGWLADRVERKRVVVAAWALGCVATLIMVLAQSLSWFALGLVLYVLTSYSASPISAYLSAARGTLSVQRTLTLFSASFSAGALLSPALGGQIARVWGFQAVFGLALVIFVVSFILALLLSPQPVVARAADLPHPGRLLASGRFVRFLLLTFAAALAFQVGLALAPNFLADVWQLDVGRVGVLGSFNALGMMALNVALGHRPAREAYVFAQVLMALSLGLILATGSVGWLAVAFFCRGSWGLARNMTITQVGQAVDQTEQLGMAYGAAETVMALALILGPLLAGLLYAWRPSLPFQVSLGLLAVTGLLMARFAPRPLPREAAP